MRTTHGATRGRQETPEYRTWQHVLNRCNKPGNEAFPAYGGRGIRVHATWVNDFAAFLAYVGPRPSPKHSIDRIDNNGHYEPGNVRWATKKEQARNRKSNKRLTLNGKTHIIQEWAELLGINACTIRRRLQLGWSTEEALTP